MAELREAQHILKEVRQDLLNDILGKQVLSDNLIKEVQVWLVGSGMAAVDKMDVHVQMKVNGELFHHVTEVHRCSSEHEMWKAIGDAVIKLVTDRILFLLTSDKEQMDSLTSVWR